SSDPAIRPQLDDEALALPLLAGSNPIWKAAMAVLTGIRTYHLSPGSLRSEPKIGSSKWLEADGANAGDILHDLGADDRDWITRHLARVTPGSVNLTATAHDGRRRIAFHQKAGDSVQDFDALEMSDGTLRTLGILLAVRQKSRPSLVFLDEIEDSIHPAAL